MPTPLNATQRAIVDNVLATCQAPRMMRNFAETLAVRNLPLEEVRRQVNEIAEKMDVRDDMLDAQLRARGIEPKKGGPA